MPISHSIWCSTHEKMLLKFQLNKWGWMEEGKCITSYGQHFKSLPRISETPVIKVTSLNYLAQDYACVAEFAEY